MQKIGLIAVKQDRCRGCGTCVEVCPVGAISLSDRKAEVDLDTCIVCRRCIPVCPQCAVTWIPETLRPTVLRLERIRREIQGLSKALDQASRQRSSPR